MQDTASEPGELVLKGKAYGICGTDLHMSDDRPARGGWRLFSPGYISGHKYSGEIVEIGRGGDQNWKNYNVLHSLLDRLW